MKFHIIHPVVVKKNSTSPGDRSMLSRCSFSCSSKMPPWLWVIALGSPVVPEENKIHSGVPNGPRWNSKSAGGYTYGGKDYDRSAELTAIIDDLSGTGLETVIYLPFKDIPPPNAPLRLWDALLDHPPVTPADFEFHRGPFGTPLWILFSSGTTGLPKAITHSHGGILLEQLKLQRLNMDLSPGDVLFFFTTTGWMMWNFMVSSLILGVRPLLYDGNPNYPAPDTLWRMAAEAKVTLFGASPAYVDTQSKRGIVPRDSHDLSALKTVM